MLFPKFLFIALLWIMSQQWLLSTFYIDNLVPCFTMRGGLGTYFIVLGFWNLGRSSEITNHI